MPEIAGDAALLVNPHHLGSMVQAMEQIVSDPNIRERLIEKGCSNVKRFSWELTTRRTAAVYARLLMAKSTPNKEDMIAEGNG